MCAPIRLCALIARRARAHSLEGTLISSTFQHLPICIISGPMRAMYQ